MKRFFIVGYVLCCLLVICSVQGFASPWSAISEDFKTTLKEASLGISQEQLFSFGKIRTLSCRTGFKRANALLTGINISLNKGWILKNYQVDVQTPSLIEAIPLIPLKPAVSVDDSWTADYTGDVVIPVVLNIPPQMNAFDFNWIATLTVCSKNGTCQVKSVADSLHLTPDKGYPTGWCGRLQTELQTVALPAERMNVSARSYLRADNTLRVQLSFPEKISYALIQPLAIQKATITQMRLSGHQVAFTVIPVDNNILKEGGKIPVLAKTNKSSYLIEIPIEAHPLPLLPTPLPIGVALLSGFLVFLMSPFWSFWLFPHQLNSGAYKSSIKLYQRSAVVSLFLLGILWLSGLFPSELIRYPIASWVLLPLLFFLLYRPVPSVWGAVVLFVILPKPFWDVLSEITWSSRLILIIYWGACLMIPLQLFYEKASSILNFFKQIRKESNLAYAIIIRLPYLMLSGWLLLGLIGYYFLPTDRSNQSSNQLTLIQINEPVCLRCSFDTLFVLNDDVLKELLKKKNVSVLRLDSRSQQAQQLIQHAETNQLPLYVLVYADGREVVLPQPMTLKNLLWFIDRLPSQTVTADAT